MSGETNHNEKQSYNAEDLRRYLAGEMSPVEMHALEQASLEDPLLGDALEGMQAVRSDTREDLTALQRRLAERTAERKRVVPLWRSPARIAAAVLVLIGLAALGHYFTTGSYAPKEVAISPQKAKRSLVSPGPAAPVAAAGADSIAPTAASTSGGDDALQNKSETAAATDAARKGSKPRASAGKTALKKEPAKEDDRIGSAPAATALAQEERVADSTQEAVAAPDYEARVAKDKPALAAAPANELLQGRAAGVAVSPGMKREGVAPGFSGQVLDQKGQALAGVSVRAGQANSITDVRGKFILPPTDGDSNHLDFTSVGYQTVTLIPDFQHRTNITVTLTPASTSLNDVVVTGLGTSKKQTSSTPVPGPGWKHYRNYLGANKIQPSIDSSLHGTEKVTFTITKNGEPVDFVVDQSLSAEHDSVAVRIIRNGPKWKPAKDSTRRMSLALPY